MRKIDINEVDIQDIYAFMEHGDSKNCPPEIQEYLLLLERVHGMHVRILQYGTKEHIFKHLEITEGISRYKAEKIYYEMLEYFYRDNKITKKIWRNILASRMEDLATAATVMSKSPDDLDKVSRMYERIAKMRQLDQVDPPELPKEIFSKPFKVYAMDAEFLGEQKINRTALARQIDALPDLNETEKLLLKQDAAIEPIKLFENESETSRRPER